MTTSQDQEIDSNVSDFDNSDEDLASLLGDDDDDIFAKKIHESPVKKAASEKPSSIAKKANLSEILSKIPSESPAKITDKSLKKTQSKDDFADDILDDFVDSKVRKKSIADLKSLPVETFIDKSKSNDEDDDFLDDLNFDQFSPSKDLSISPSKKNIKKTSKENSSDFDSIDKSVLKSSKERRGSFFDDFLQKLSPKHDTKKTSTDTSLKKLPKDENEENEDDILGAYLPTAPKKIETTISDAVSKSPKKRGSLYKQVSFKDLSDDFSETLPDASETPAKEVSSKQQSLSEPKRNERNTTTSKRSEKFGSDKSEDMDWLNFFKETPKSSEQPKKKDDTNFDKKEVPDKNKSKPGIRRQSSANWLGLSESKMLDINEFGDGVQIKESEVNLENLKPRPQTADEPIIINRPHSINKRMDDWNDDNGFKADINLSEKSDLSHILKQTNKEDRPTSATSRRSAVKPSVVNTSSKSKFVDQVAPKKHIPPNALSDSFITEQIGPPTDSNFDLGFNVSPIKESQFQSIHSSSEQASTIHSLQLLLDNSMKERNKLLQENETLKLTYEEKIKAIEEIHKTEKKSHDDLCNTKESGLKKEFEIKLKSLEERLNTFSVEKEKQEKDSKEKLENVFKEHKIELQRLKDLHNQSVKLMKEDHEDALSRLKQLKEQELEAVQSTQVHSKSLQHLNDQLEARANELAELQNKVEGRNQSMLRDRQALLDTKERDLKALQNRLQKQLDDSEEERTRLQQLVLRLESRLQKMTMEGEEDHWEVQQMKAKLTVQQKYLEEEQKLNLYQIEKEKEKLRISQDSLLHEQKAVLLQLAQERHQFVQEKIDLQSLAKNIKEEEAKLNVRKLKEESYVESQKQYLQEESNRLHFEKERVKQDLYHLERERDSLQKEKLQIKNEKENLRELEVDLRRKSAEIEQLAASAIQEQEKGRREHAVALNIKTEQKFKMEQYTQQMQMLMDKERQILLEKEKLMEEKLELEKSKNTILCTKCKSTVETLVPAPPAELSMPAVMPLPSFHGIASQVQHSYVDPNLVIWHIAAQKDREFLQQELAFLQSLKGSHKYS